MPKKKNDKLGRPEGAQNKRNNFVRDEAYSLRVSEGFNKVTQLLIDAGFGPSKADVVHDALKHYALSKKLDEKLLFWINRI